MAAKQIELKGHQYTLFSITPESNDLSKLTAQLSAKMAQAPKLLEHAPVAVTLTETLTELSPPAIKQAVAEAGFILAAVVGGTEAQKDAAHQAGIAILNSNSSSSSQHVRKAQTQPVKSKQQPQPSQLPSKVVHGPIRSGQQVYAKGADLVVMGQVSAGAEVIADGSIHIYGTLRGKAIAGVQGQAEARVYCQSLQAELVSICGTYWLNETLQEHGWQQAVSIALQDGQLQATSL